jgi:hypothetical protein
MPKDTQYGNTLFITELQAGDSVTKLTRVHFSKNASEIAGYDEEWLQRLIMNHPHLLPVDQIEPAFANLVPICIELPLSSGFLDNLLITPTGDLALIECKLWRNPEARREVIAQIIDYANAMSTWTYERLQEAVNRTKPLTKETEGGSRNLYELVCSRNELGEASFIDAVSRNLRRGRFLLLIVGDGIREGVESMTEFLQQHAGLHFTLGIVEIALFEVPTGGFIAQPRVLARTTNIDRGIVSFEDGRIEIRPSAEASVTASSPARRMTITKELYFEQLEMTFPGISRRLNAFIDKVADYGVVPEFGSATMILRWHPDGTESWNLATIPVTGYVWTDYLGHQASSRGLINISKQYLKDLAALVPGAFVKETPKESAWYVSLDGKIVTIDKLLGDEARAEGWLVAIAALQRAISKALKVD